MKFTTVKMGSENHQVMKLEDVQTARINYVKTLMDYSESQVSLWKKIPYQALQLQGRSGWSSTYNAAFTKGIWILRSVESHDYNSIGVDCHDGRLMDFDKYVDLEKTYIHSKLLPLNPEYLDAEKIIQEIKDSMHRYGPEDMSLTQGHASNWRELEAEKYGITESYTRERKVPAPDFGWID